MPSVLKKLVMARKKRVATGSSRQQPSTAPDKIVWVYKPLDLPFEPKHLTKEQIQDAVDKLPA